MKRLFPFICLVSLAFRTYCQTTQIKIDSFEINKACPEFTLNKVQYYKFQKVTLNDFKGKWLILDFWHKYCSACVKSFKETDRLQNEFMDSIQFILIGREDKENGISSLYEKFRKKQDLKLSVCFDSTMHNRFGIYACPYIVIIDPKGIVRGIVYSLNSDILGGFITRKDMRAVNINQKSSYNPDLPLLVYNNGGSDTDYLYRSMLAKWNPLLPNITPAKIDYLRKDKFEVLKAPIEWLYKYAYIGKPFINFDDSLNGEKLYPLLVWEIKSPSCFQPNWKTGENLFCYSLQVPKIKANREYIMTVMQRDLKNYFNFDVIIERRKVPYWSLVTLDKAKNKLKAKSLSPEEKIVSHSGFSLKNSPVSFLIELLSSYFQDTYPFIDETGINYNIDVSVDALLTDFDDFRMGLNKNGLELIRKEKEMQVIVVKIPEKIKNQLETSTIEQIH